MKSLRWSLSPLAEPVAARWLSGLRWGLGTIAVALAAGGEALLRWGAIGWGLALFALAMTALAAGAHSLPLASAAAGPRRTATQDRFRGRRQVLAAGVVALGLLALALKDFGDGPRYTLGWYAYAFSVACAMYALGAVDGVWHRLALLFRRGLRLRLAPEELATWVLLGAVLALAAGLRLYRIQNLPAGLWYDELDNLEWATRLRQDPGMTPVYAPSTNLPSLYLVLMSWVMMVAGDTLMAGRLVSVAFGLAGTVAVFLLVRSALGRWTGLAAALVTALLRWDLIWSRIGMHGITAPFFAALTAWLTLRALRRGRLWDYGLAGASLGLGMWFYSPFRLFPIVVAFMIVHHALVRRPCIKGLALKTAVLVAMALLVAAPVIQVAIIDPSAFFARTATISITRFVPREELPGQLWENAREHLLMFQRQGDPNPRHNLPGEPMLDLVGGVLLVLGVGTALARWRDTALFTLPFWGLFMLVPGIVTIPWESPQSLRSIGALPAVVGLICLGLKAVAATWSRAPWPQVARATPALALVVLGSMAFLNVDTYFGRQASDPRVYAAFSTDETLRARDMARRKHQGFDLWVSRQFLYSIHVRLMAPDLQFRRLRVPEDVPFEGEGVSRGIAVYLEPREEGFYRLLKAYYPQGSFQEVRPPGGGEVLYYLAVLDRSVLDETVGLQARYTLADGGTSQGVVRETQVAWALELTPDDVPAQFQWLGSLQVREVGEYTLALEGDTEAEVLLDGVPLLDSERRRVRIAPAVGLHRLELRGRVTSASQVLRLLWAPPGRELAPIGPPHLYQSTVRPVGLAGRFYQGGNIAGAPSAMRITPSTDTFYYDPVLPVPYTAVWDGWLEVPESGRYRFEVLADGDLRLYIDGILRAQNRRIGAIGSVASLQLARGPHNIRLVFAAPPKSARFILRWAPPGGEFAPLPIEALEPDPQAAFRTLR